MDTDKIISFKGNWWLPSEKQKEIGELTIIENKEIRLKLNYFLGIQKGIQINGIRNFKIILGETTDYEKITLLNCWAADFLGKHFNIEYVFVGEHFNSLDDIKFKSIEFEYTYLNEWAYPFWYEQTLYQNKVKTTYIKKEPIKLFLNIPHNKIDLLFSFNLIDSLDNLSKKREAVLLAKSEKQRTFSEWWNVVVTIRNFLILGMFKPIYSNILEAETEKGEKIDIYRVINVNVNLSNLRFYNMLFTLEDIGGNMEEYLNNFFKKSNKLKDVTTGLFIVLNNPEMGLENQLIQLSGLTEKYFRDNKNSLVIKRNIYDELRIKIIDLIKNQIDPDPDLPQCFIENNVVNKYGYQKNFRTILRELVNNVVKIFQLVSGFNKDYCNKVINTRNYFIHKDEQLKDKAEKGEMLYDIIRFLEMVLVINILKDIGFDDNIVKKVFDRFDEFNSIINRITRTIQ